MCAMTIVLSCRFCPLLPSWYEAVSLFEREAEQVIGDVADGALSAQGIGFRRIKLSQRSPLAWTK